MNRSEEVAKKFYEAFARLDAKTMNACYASEVTFSDPAFPGLDALEVKGMWEILTSSAKNFHMTFKVIESNDSFVKTVWVARYTFSRTGRPVENHVTTTMELKDGLIVRQRDVFDFPRWARQAFGPLGLLIGWTPFFQKKVQKTAREGLEKHLAVR